MISQKDETATKQQQELTEFYRNKYPASVGNTEAQAEEIKLSARELQDENQRFSDGVFKANRASNAAMLEKLAQAFKNRNKGA